MIKIKLRFLLILLTTLFIIPSESVYAQACYTPVISAGGSTTICIGSSVTLSAASQVATDLSFTAISIGTHGTDQWQSFIPTITGITTGIQLFKNGTSLHSGTFSIYTGVGVGGTLIHSQAYSMNSTGWYTISLPNLDLTAGANYTFRLQGTDVGLVANNGTYGSYFSNAYGSPAWRLDFITNVIPTIGTVQWYKDAVLIPGATATTYDAGITGSYTCRGTNGACSSAPSNSLSVSASLARPTASLSGSATICNGSSATIGISVTGSGTINGTLSPGNIAFSGTAPLINVSVSPTTSTNYTVATLSNSSCTSIAADLTGSMIVNVEEKPTAALSGSTNICPGTNATIGIAVTGSGTISGTLNPGAIPFSGTAPLISVNVSPTISTTYTIASLANSICTAGASEFSGSTVVNIITRPTANVTGNSTICPGNVAPITINVTGTGTITGIINPGSIPFSGTAPSITVNFSPAFSTTYTVATLSDENCTALPSDLSGSATINVLPAAIVNVGDAMPSICQGGTSVPLGGSYGGSASFAIWSDGTAGGTFTNNTGSTPQTVTYTASLTAPPTVTLTLIASGGCASASDSKTITINTKPIVSSSYVNGQGFCTGTAANIVLNSSATVQNSFSYTSIADPLVSGNSNCNTVCGNTIFDILSYSGATFGNLTYFVTNTTIHGCVSDLFTLPVTVSKIPTATTSGNQTICSGTQTSITLGSDMNNVSYRWTSSVTSGAATGFTNSNGGSTSINNTLVNLGSVPAAITYNIKAVSSTGCIGSSTSVLVTVNPQPFVTNNVQSPICSGAATSINLNASLSGSTISWTASQISGPAITGFSNGSGTSIVQILNNSNNLFSGIIRYRATATSNIGCVGSPVNIDVTVLPNVAAPTAVNSSQCGSGIPDASVISNAGVTGGYGFTWYDQPAGGNLLQAPSNPVTYNNNFSSGAGSATLTGSAFISGGTLALHPNTPSVQGGITVPASGNSLNRIQIDFDAINFGQADGFSYSFADDADATITSYGIEQGSGSKLFISFDAYGSMPNGAGIYLCYGQNPASYSNSITSTMLAYAGTNFFMNGSNLHYTISINNIGQLTLWVSGSTIFNNVQLPAAYLSANKSNWKHVIAGRTGALAMFTSIDNLTIQQFGGMADYSSSISATTSFYVAETASNGCQSSRSLVTANVTAIPVVANATAIPQSVCFGNSSLISATTTGNSINWYTASTGGTLVGSTISGASLNVTPASTTTYYAEAINVLSGGGQTGNILNSPTIVNSGNNGSFTIGYSFTPSVNINVTAFRRFWGSKISIWTNSGTLIYSQAVSGTNAVWTDNVLPAPITLLAGTTYRIAAYSNGNTYFWKTGGATSFAHGTINAGFEIGGDAFPTTNNGILWYFVDLVYSTNTICSSPSRVPVTVTVGTLAAPTNLTAAQSSICQGGSTTISATSAGYTISWFTAPSGGSSIGNSASTAAFNVTPAATTTYYAEVQQSNIPPGYTILNSPASASITGNNVSGTLGYAFTPTANISVTAFRRFFGSKISIWTNTGTLIYSQAVSGTNGVWTDNVLPTPIVLNAGTTYRIAAFTSTGNPYYYNTGGATTFPHAVINGGYDGAGDAFPTNNDGVFWFFVDIKYTVIGSALLNNAVHNAAGTNITYTFGYSFTPNTDILVTHFRRYEGSKISIWNNAGTLIYSQAVTGTNGVWTNIPLSTTLVLNAGTTYRIAAFISNSNFYYSTGVSFPSSFSNGTINASWILAGGDGFPTTTDGNRHFVDIFYSTSIPCVSPRTPVTVTVNPLPVVNFTGLPASTCVNAGAITLTGSPAGGTFSGPGIVGNTFDPALAGVGGPYTITYTYTNGNGCSNSQVKTVSVNASSTVSFSGLSSSYCINESPVTLTGIPAGGTFSGPGISGSTFNPASSGIGGPYIITYTYTNSNGCISSLSQNVMVNALPVVSFSGLSATYCLNASPATLLGIPANGVFSGAGIIGDTFDPSLAGVGGPYTITYTYTNSNGCINSQTQTVTVNELPSSEPPTVTTIQPNCTSATGTITFTSPLAANLTYSIGGAFQVSPIFENLGPGNYSLSVINTAGCYAPSTASVTINPQPFIPTGPIVTGLVNVCPFVGTGDPITYTFSAAGATGYNYILPPNVSLVSSTANSITINFLNGFASQANKQIKVTASSACGTSIQTIYYLAAQAPGTAAPITGNTNVCPIIGTPGTYSYTIPSVVGASSYVWTTQAGTTTVTHPNGPGVNDTTVTVSFSAGFTSSSISVAASNGCGTGSARSLALTKVNPSTPGLISGPTNACANIAPGGTAATYSIAPVAGATSYNWVVPSGAIGLTGQGTTSISFIYPSTFVSGSISVTATNGCGTGSARSLLISKLNPATPSVIDVIQTQACPNRVYTYTLASMPANATSVQWMIPIEGTMLSGQGSTSITVSYPPTSVNGNVTAQSFNNCGSSTIRSSVVKLGACETAPPPPFAKQGNQSVASMPVVESFEVNVSPNPSATDFKIKLITAGKQTINMRLMDAQGRLYKRFEILPYQSIQIGADLKAGAYLLEVRQGEEVKVTRLIKF